MEKDGVDGCFEGCFGVADDAQDSGSPGMYWAQRFIGFVDRYDGFFGVVFLSHEGDGDQSGLEYGVEFRKFSSCSILVLRGPVTVVYSQDIIPKNRAPTRS